MSDFLLAILSFGIVLIPLIIIHELGHFFAAKSVGITVLEFGIGIPPRALTLFERGGTQYTLNWVPLGGFVRPYGEDFMSPKDEEGVSADLSEVVARGIPNPKSVFEAGPWERIWFFSAGAIANFIAALLLFILMAFIGFPQVVDADVSLVEIFDDSPAAVAGLEAGDIVTHVNGQEILTAADFDQSVSGRDEVTLTILRDGDTQEVTLAPSADFEVGRDAARVVITEVLSDSPAAEAGLQPDDVFLRVSNGETTQEINSLTQLQEFTRDHEDQPLTFTVQRGTRVIEHTITPEEIQGQVRIGITITLAEPESNLGVLVATTGAETEIVPADNLIEAVEIGVDQFNFMVGIIVQAPIDIIQGVIPLEQARPVSPVGISQIGGETLQQSQDVGHPYPIIGFAAVISIALAITNLLPIPALDGGRILFVIIELLRGKPISPEREGLVHLIGFMFLFSLIIVIALLDIFMPVV